MRRTLRNVSDCSLQRIVQSKYNDDPSLKHIVYTLYNDVFSLVSTHDIFHKKTNYETIPMHVIHSVLHSLLEHRQTSRVKVESHWIHRGNGAVHPGDGNKRKRGG